MTALEPRNQTRPPGDRLDQAVVVALGLAACALALAGLTSQRLGVPAALWVAAGGAVPLSLGMVLILHERGRQSRERERVKRRETAAILAEKLEQARQRAAAQPVGETIAPPVADNAEARGPGDGAEGMRSEPETVVVPRELERSLERVAQLEETVIDLNRQVSELQRVIQGTPRGARGSRAGRHSGPPEAGSPDADRPRPETHVDDLMDGLVDGLVEESA
jgi:ubiquinone biosynthesis protein UbiJ